MHFNRFLMPLIGIFVFQGVSWASQNEDQYDPRIPRRLQERINWSVSVLGAPKAFGSDGASEVDGSMGSSSGNTTTRSRAISTRVERYRPFFKDKRSGIVSLGGTVSFYPVTQSGSFKLAQGVTSHPFAIVSLGANARYQVSWFESFPVAPYIGVNVDVFYLSFRTIQGSKNKKFMPAAGGFGGLLWYWDTLDKTSAADLYINTGTKRSFVMAEYRFLSSAGSGLSLSAQPALYAGLGFGF